MVLTFQRQQLSTDTASTVRSSTIADLSNELFSHYVLAADAASWFIRPIAHIVLERTNARKENISDPTDRDPSFASAR